MKEYFVYILASKKKGTLYIGVTNDLLRRVQEHKLKQVEGFTNKYEVNMLVYYEMTNDVYTALNREKQLKRWKRNWKIRVIEEMNPDWKDLFFELGGFLPSMPLAWHGAGMTKTGRGVSPKMSLPRTAAA